MLDLNEQLKTALKAKDALRATVLRALKTAIDNEAIKQKKKDEGLSDEEIVAVLKREANKRKDAFNAYQDAGREEQAAQEQAELVIIEEFLPEQMSEEEIAKIVDEVIAQVGASSAQDFGKVMGPVMGRIGTAADGSIVSAVVKNRLS